MRGVNMVHGGGGGRGEGDIVTAISIGLASILASTVFVSGQYVCGSLTTEACWSAVPSAVRKGHVPPCATQLTY
jgi:hypothetical protein